MQGDAQEVHFPGPAMPDYESEVPQSFHIPGLRWIEPDEKKKEGDKHEKKTK